VKVINLVIGTFLLGVAISIGFNLRTAMNRAAEKRTMADIWAIAEAWEKRANDVHRYAVGGPVPAARTKENVNWKTMPRVSYADLRRALVPKYLPKLPEKDAWKTPYEFAAFEQSYAIRSLGKNRSAEADIYASKSHLDYDLDLVYADGHFIWYPEGVI
jgi:hypothetical protein